MKEAIGGVWIINIILFFIMAVIGYLAITINYTRAFRIKNVVVNTLEEFGNKDAALDALDDRDFFVNTGYIRSQDVGSSEDDGINAKKIQIISTGNGSTIGFARACKFKVRIGLDIVIPIVNYKLPVFVEGETRSIYNGKSDCGA